MPNKSSVTCCDKTLFFRFFLTGEGSLTRMKLGCRKIANGARVGTGLTATRLFDIVNMSDEPPQRGDGAGANPTPMRSLWRSSHPPVNHMTHE